MIANEACSFVRDWRDTNAYIASVFFFLDILINYYIDNWRIHILMFIFFPDVVSYPCPYFFHKYCILCQYMYPCPSSRLCSCFVGPFPSFTFALVLYPVRILTPLSIQFWLVIVTSLSLDVLNLFSGVSVACEKSNSVHQRIV